MRIFFSGSLRHLHEVRDAHVLATLKTALGQLGAEVARRGHTLLVTTDTKLTVDRHLLEGALQGAAAYELRPKVEVHHARGQEDHFGIDPRLDVVRVEYDRWADRADARLGARSGALARADVVVLIGGAKGTRKVAQAALALGRQILPLPTFGGVADQILREFAPLYLQRPEIVERLRDVQREWTGPAGAATVLDLAELTAAGHAYFLSCSEADAQACDHLELLLRRRGRAVLREEGAEESGAAALRQRIASAQTFVALWGRAYRSSGRCLEELECALGALRDAGGDAIRIVLVRVDDCALPVEFGSFAYGAATGREQRAELVARLVTEEKLRQQGEARSVA